MIVRVFCTGLTALALACPGTSCAQLSPTEKAIVAAVEQRAPEALVFLEQLVNVNSGTLNHVGVREVGRMMRKELDALGFETRWVDMSSVNRAGHLVATRKGGQGKRLLLLGHLDTVFEKDSPTQRWERKGDKATGPGVSDMKGGDVVMLEALRALHQAGALANTTITLVFTGDEERVGDPIEVARRDLVEAAKQSDAVLSFEGISIENGKVTATVARRSAGSWSLKATGKQAHSSGMFGKSAGFGAIYEAARILNAFREDLPEANLSFSPGLILGGTDVKFEPEVSRGTAFGKNNVIANTVRATGDLRALTEVQLKATQANMRAIVAKNLPGTSADIAFVDAYPPMAPTAGNEKLRQMLSKASEDAGLGSIASGDPGARGAGDIQFAAPYADCLDGIGAGGDGAHSPREELDVRSISVAAQRAALLIYRLTRP